MDETPRPNTERGSTITVGRVLGSQDSTPLNFWIGIEPGSIVQLDDLVVIETTTGVGVPIRFYGVVDEVKKRYEGTDFDSDAFRVAEGVLPVEVSYSAHIQVTRIEPEVFVPPHPADVAQLAAGSSYDKALHFDRMERRLPIGMTRGNEPVFANLEFIDGTRGAHVSISGISGVATKTSYATFLLYSLFHSGTLGVDAINTKAIIFNVKGEDLLWLDKPNNRLDEQGRAAYQRLGLPAGPFSSVGLYAPTRRNSDVPIPDTGGRQEGVHPYLWTLREFAVDRLLKFAFSDAEDGRSQLHMVISRVEDALARYAAATPPGEPGLAVDGNRTLRTFGELTQYLDQNLDSIVTNMQIGTLDAFRRRLYAVNHRLGFLIRGSDQASNRQISWDDHQVTVIDIHTLHSTAQMFVVGVILRRMMNQKETQGTAHPLVFVVLDELNKYAPRTGWSPIGDILLDIAERGRSLGISLFGAQQTASEVERRVVGNAALKVVGRLDAAEADRGEYGFLTKTARQRSTLLQPGTMIVAQPDIPTPILLRFPFPSWATRQSEAVDVHSSGADPFSGMGG
jgi:DNA helicase HerA-like ATPase